MKYYLLTYLLVVVMYYDERSLICRRLLVAGGKDKTAQKPASAAVTKTTQKERKAPQLLPQNINDWTSSDINKWLRNNNLQHLRSWYTTLFFIVTLYTFMAYVEKYNMRILQPESVRRPSYADEAQRICHCCFLQGSAAR